MSKKKPKKSIRPLGDIMTDMEPFLFEMHVDHDLQTQELVGLLLTWSTTHFAKQIPKYNDVTLVPALYIKDGPHVVFGPVKKGKSK